MILPWRRPLHVLSVTAFFLLLGACIVWLLYAAVLLYGIIGYVAIAGITLFLVIWDRVHRE